MFVSLCPLTQAGFFFLANVLGMFPYQDYKKINTASTLAVKKEQYRLENDLVPSFH